jgi:hypothetical protein
MELKTAIRRPELVKLTLDDAETIATYGEALDFWVQDPQPMHVYAELVTLRDNDFAQIIEVMRRLVLDSQGQPMIGDGETLPHRTLVRVVERVMNRLGE